MVSKSSRKDDAMLTWVGASREEFTNSLYSLLLPHIRLLHRIECYLCFYFHQQEYMYEGW